MECPPSTSKVSFADEPEVHWQHESVERGPDGESDFDYIESTSEAGSSSDEEDAEKLEAILGAVFTSSPSKGRLEPAERQSLLLFDKDLAEEEDLEAGIHTSFVTLSLCFAS